MCGIAGFIDSNRILDEAEIAMVATKMARTMEHRGPDDEGVWVDAAAGVALGHRRLAVIDLSPSGHQPMLSASGRFVISYNGEVYNAPELRSELEESGIIFGGYSDTEVIVEACAAWGVEACVQRLIGMFAFAVWDRQSRILSLVRDRLGIKPLYWAAFPRLFLFGSELKALRAHTGWAFEIDRVALAGYMRHGYVAGPRSIYQGVAKLAPGHVLTFREDRGATLARYWDARATARAALAAGCDLSAVEAADQLEALLRDAVGRQMAADVPIGVFLSGGIDSSTVTALMQAQTSQPVKTFTIGFREDRYNEAAHARAVASHLGTDHTELYVEPAHALEILPRIPEWFDEPFADSSQIPTYLLAELTRQHVTVALSGDGGDELFAGYDRYFRVERLWQTFRRLPGGLRRGAGALLKLVPEQSWDWSASIIPAGLRPSRMGTRLHKLAAFLADGRSDTLYRQVVSHWTPPSRVVLGAMEPEGPLWDPSIVEEVPDLLARMQLLDLLTYLPDDILTKVDRASMAVGLEARVPLLDHRVVEFAQHLPSGFKAGADGGKWLLRQVLYRYIPKPLVDRRKSGFAVPLGTWLRGPLREWAETLLDPHRLRAQGHLEAGPIQALWLDHCARRQDWSALLWDVLMFQAWLEHRFAPRRTAAAWETPGASTRRATALHS